MKTWLSWSGGKDSAWALYQLQQQADIEITGLVVTLNEKYQRIAMHGTPKVLLDEQVKQLGVPCYPVFIPDQCDNDTYQQRMAALIAKAEMRGVEAMVFGDLFLEDIRAYRENQLKQTALTPLFPLWQLNTADLARTMIQSGLKAKLSCVDTKKLPAEFAGRDYDENLLADLPQGIDPCGENGEFHTFVYDSPSFQKPINIETKGVHTINEFVFCDIKPA